jgi:hypothetical protein
MSRRRTPPARAKGVAHNKGSAYTGISAKPIVYENTYLYRNYTVYPSILQSSIPVDRVLPPRRSLECPSTLRQPAKLVIVDSFALWRCAIYAAFAHLHYITFHFGSRKGFLMSESWLHTLAPLGLSKYPAACQAGFFQIQLSIRNVLSSKGKRALF